MQNVYQKDEDDFTTVDEAGSDCKTFRDPNKMLTYIESVIESGTNCVYYHR
jgi:hypothetical protein